MTVEHLAHTLSQNEYEHWRIYAAKKLLPKRSLEMHLAQVTKWIAGSMGGVKNASIEEFLFEHTPEKEATVEEVHEFFQFKPYKKNLPVPESTT